MKRLSLLAILPVMLLLVPAGPAHAASLIDDCQDGRIDGTYSQEEFRRALRNISADFDQYTDCRRVIRRAQLAAAGGDAGPARPGAEGGGAGGTGGSGGAAGGTSTEAPASALRADPLESATPEERRAFEQATTGGGGPIRVGQAAVRPGADAAAGDVPGPLLALLALLAIAGLGYGAAVTRARVIARRAG